MQTLFDAHLHAAWARDLPGLARDCAGSGLAALAVTTTPREYLEARRALSPDAGAGAGGLWLAPGLHPWWVAAGHCGEGDVRLACELVAGCRVVGEVGLDHSPAHVGSDGGAAQARALLAVCRACARTSDAASPKVLSVHAVRSAGAALDVLEASGALGACRCVLHWFSGSSEELVRGCCSRRTRPTRLGPTSRPTTWPRRCAGPWPRWRACAAWGPTSSRARWRETHAPFSPRPRARGTCPGRRAGRIRDVARASARAGLSPGRGRRHGRCEIRAGRAGAVGEC